MLHLLLEVTLIYRPLNDHVTKRISLSFLTKGLNAPKQNLAPQHTKRNPKNILTMISFPYLLNQTWENVTTGSNVTGTNDNTTTMKK